MVIASDWILKATLGKSRSPRVAAALALARERGLPVEEQQKRGSPVHVVSFDASSSESALSLVRDLKDLQTCSFSVNGETHDAGEIINALGCYVSRGCPKKYSKILCDVDSKGLFSTFGCALTAIRDETRHAWWTFGALKEIGKNSWIWSFHKTKIRSLLSVATRTACCCPVFPVEDVERRRDAIPDAIPISPEKGMIDFFDNLGIPRDYLRYPTETSADYAAHSEDLVQVSKHSGTCPLCSKWQGKIFSVSGTSAKYPPFALALQGGLFHPHCRHAEACFIPDDAEDSPRPNMGKIRSALGSWGIGKRLLALIVATSSFEKFWNKEVPE